MQQLDAQVKAGARHFLKGFLFAQRKSATGLCKGSNRELRSRFRAWCAARGSTTKDELLRYMMEVTGYEAGGDQENT